MSSTSTARRGSTSGVQPPRPPLRGDFFAEEEAEEAETEFGAAGEEILGEDDALEEMEDVLVGGEFEEEGGFESGASSTEFDEAPVVGRLAAPVEQDWGTGTFVGLAATTLLLCLSGMLMFDLVSTMWAWTSRTPSAAACWKP